MSITVQNVSKRFGSFLALNDVSLEADERLAAGAAGAVRLGQDDAAAHHRRPGNGRRGHGSVPRRGGDAHAGPRPQRRLRVPALRPVPAHDGVREHRLRPARPRPAAAPRCRTASDELLALIRLEGLERRYPSATLRRPAAARGAGPGAGGRAEGAAAGRAVRRPRRQGAAGAAALAAPAARRDPRHQHVRDARSGRGLRSGRPGGRHERGPHRAGGHAGARCSSTRPTPS